MQPLISVIVPIYNKDRYIADLISNIKVQTFRSFECIIIDDGSTDRSGTLCDELTRDDEHFIVRHIQNQGVSHARNVALDIAKGEFITFIDADDNVPENYLECLYQDITKNRSDLTICTMTKVWNSGKKQQMSLPLSGVTDFQKLLPDFAACQKDTGIYGYCCGKLISKNVIAKERFDQKLNLAEDFLFYLNIYPRVKKISFTNETEYFYQQESENSSAVVDDRLINYSAQLDINVEYKHFLEKMGVCTENNRSTVFQLLSNYIFYILFYCEIFELKNSFRKVRKIYREEQINLHGRNLFEKWILCLVQHNQYWLTKKSLQGYRFFRKIVRRV